MSDIVNRLMESRIRKTKQHKKYSSSESESSSSEEDKPKKKYETPKVRYMKKDSDRWNSILFIREFIELLTESEILIVNKGNKIEVNLDELITELKHNDELSDTINKLKNAYYDIK